MARELKGMKVRVKGEDDIHTLEYCYIFNNGSSDIMVRSVGYGYSKVEWEDITFIQEDVDSKIENIDEEIAELLAKREMILHMTYNKTAVE